MLISILIGGEAIMIFSLDNNKIDRFVENPINSSVISDDDDFNSCRGYMASIPMEFSNTIHINPH